jgi:hypothetical protein
MRAFAGLICLSAAFLTPTAFAQVKETAKPQTGSLAESGKAALAPASDQQPVGKGWIDKLSLTKSAERPILPLAPIQTDQLNLSWNAGGNWGLTFGLTNREENDVLPREELKAGAYFQVNPNFRVGGGVSLNGETLRGAAEGWKDSRSPKEAEAGVRIESAFKF